MNHTRTQSGQPLVPETVSNTTSNHTRSKHTRSKHTRSKHTTIGTWALAIDLALQGKGIDPEPIFEAVGIDRSAIKNPELRIPVSTMNNLWKKSVEVTQDSAFGLTVADYVFPTHLSALLFAVQSSGSLKESVNRIVRYSNIVTTIGGAVAREEYGDLFVEIQLYEQQDTFPPKPIEALIATAAKTFNNIMAQSDQAVRDVSFKRAIPPNPGSYTDFFKCPVKFNAERNEIRIRGDVINKPLPGGNPMIAEIQDELLNDYLKRLNQKSLRMKVNEQILTLLLSGDVTQDVVASKLNMSSRSLHRKLSEEDTTFKQLLDSVKKDLAVNYLKVPTISIIELTYILGFTDQSSFTRAFRRWTDCTPSQYREKL